MVSANAALASSYDYHEVARSAVIAVAASYVGLDLAGRVTAAMGRARLAWLGGGATAMGIGIWTMHMKGMLAFRLPVPVEYCCTRASNIDHFRFGPESNVARCPRVSILKLKRYSIVCPPNLRLPSVLNADQA